MVCYAKRLSEIDYNKYNLNSENLISLCRKCHRKTNDNREYWMSYFKGREIISN